MTTIDTWLRSNKLTINTSKTKTIFFGTKRTLQKYHSENLIVNYNHTPLDTEKAVKYLGVNFDEEMNWDSHIRKIKGKAYHKLYKLKQIDNCLTPSTRKLLVNALIIPYLTYCSSSWCNASKTRLRPLQSLFNRTQDFLSLPRKPIENVWNYNMALTTFKAIYALVPDYLCSKIALSKFSHTHNTRFTNNNSLKVRLNGSKYWQKTFQYRSPTIWNDLHIGLRNTTSILKFKTGIKNVFNL